MTPKEANDEVLLALRVAQEATDVFLYTSERRDETLARLTKARENLEDILRESAGLDARIDRKEEYLRLYTFKR